MLSYNIVPLLTRLCSYSGSDIAIVVRDSLMQPVRKVLSATHFKRVPSNEDPNVMKWTPCSPGDPEGVEKNWSTVESDELQEPPLRFADFLKSLESVRPTVTADDIVKHDEWTKESGELLFLSSLGCISLTRLYAQARMVHDLLALDLVVLLLGCAFSRFSLPHSRPFSRIGRSSSVVCMYYLWWLTSVHLWKDITLVATRRMRQAAAVGHSSSFLSSGMPQVVVMTHCILWEHPP